MAKLTLSFKGRVLKMLPVEAGKTVIGSGPDCDIQIDSLAVGDHHARLTARDARFLLEDLGSSSGTFVNNQRVSEHELQEGDVIRIGKHTLSFSLRSDAVVPPAAALEPPEHQTRTAWLQILSGKNLGQTIKLRRGMTNIGKPGVQTAVIAHRREGYFLSHLEGPEPPSVADQPIGNTPTQLRDGDIIRLGPIKMQFYLE